MSGQRGEFDGPAAWEAIIGNPSRSLPRTLDRFAAFPINVEHRTKFSLLPGSRIFCIGSCFARNIEEHLIYNDASVSSRKIISPREEWSGRPNGIVNKFTTPSMLNEVRWAAEQPTFSDSFFERAGEGLYADLQLAPGNRPVSLDRAIERRRYLASDYFPRIFEADVVVITLGLDECWHDREAGIDLNGTPSHRAVKEQPERYFVRALGFADTLGALETFAEIISAHNESVRFIITVSPVPLAVTFVSVDPIVATMRAKAMLRTVAESFCAARDNADYYPAYEMITTSPRAQAFRSDCRHVSEDAVGEVVRRFIKSYTGRESADGGAFVEMPYLVANPDVEDAVRRGEYESGFAHWLAHGLEEGRALWPEKPDRRMMKKEMLQPPSTTPIIVG